MMVDMDVRPIDTARAARYVIAILDNDTPKAVQAFNEASNEGTVDLMMSALAGEAIGFLRLANATNDQIKQLFIQVILKAQLDEEN